MFTSGSLGVGEKVPTERSESPSLPTGESGWLLERKDDSVLEGERHFDVTSK